MGKWGKYKKKHKAEWENDPMFHGWLISNKDGSLSYCKLCSTELRAHKADLKSHAATSKHKQNMSKLHVSQKHINNYGISVANNSIKKKELTLASFIATHTTIRSVDHITDIINNITVSKPSSSQSEQEKLHLHRTKCSALIKEVIAPSLLCDLVQDVGNSPFSIIVDESTDVATEKLLCICIKYYSEKKNDIVTQFLTFLNVVHTTAQDLYQVIVDFFNSINLSLKNLIGIGTDGAANLCGKNNSLYTLLKTNIQLDQLVLVKCICHSLHLCSSKASEVFSDEIDFLLKETYNWFRNSAVRLSKYRQIYDLINTDNNFIKLTQLSTTRWLSRYRAVDKILTQYLELETFFLINAQKERCHTAKILSDAFKDKRNKIILTFLQPILKQIYYLNLYFQKGNVDYYQAFNDVKTTIWSLARQIFKPAIVNHLDDNLDLLVNAMKHEQNYLDLDACDLGYCFSQELDAANLSLTQILEIKTKCFQFIKTLLDELIKRMPAHLNIFSQIRNFSPNIILSHVRPKFPELPLHWVHHTKMGDVEAQYRNLLNINWEQVFQGNIPDDAILFWRKAITLKNAAEDFMFKELSLLAFTMLSFPSSNAIVERTFSIMNIVKCKIRNQMMLKMLNAIMIIRYYFSINGICCKTFQPTPDMISRFNSKMYDTAQEKTVDADQDEEVILFCGEFL